MMHSEIVEKAKAAQKETNPMQASGGRLVTPE